MFFGANLSRFVNVNLSHFWDYFYCLSRSLCDLILVSFRNLTFVSPILSLGLACCKVNMMDSEMSSTFLDLALSVLSVSSTGWKVASCWLGERKVELMRCSSKVDCGDSVRRRLIVLY